MGGEMGGVDQHRHTRLVGQLNEAADRREPAAHVRRPGHREKLRVRVAPQRAGDRVWLEGPLRVALDVAHLGVATPGEKVGMVLDDGGHHHVIGTEVEAEGEVVDGFDGVAADDCHVVGVFSPREN